MASRTREEVIVMGIETVPGDAPVGAEIRGVDLSRPVGDNQDWFKVMNLGLFGSERAR